MHLTFLLRQRGLNLSRASDFSFKVELDFSLWKGCNFLTSIILKHKGLKRTRGEITQRNILKLSPI